MMSASSKPICGWAIGVSSILTTNTFPSPPSRPLIEFIGPDFLKELSESPDCGLMSASATTASEREAIVAKRIFLKNIAFKFIDNWFR